MPLTSSVKPDDQGPSFVPISLQINSSPFISGPTTIELTITPEFPPERTTGETTPELVFVLGYYTIGGMMEKTDESTGAIIVELDPLDEAPDYYFANPPIVIPLDGETAVYDLETLSSIMDLAGKTLVITATSATTMILSNTAAVTVIIATV